MMADDKEWTTVFYVDDSGHIPVQDFLRNLDNTTQTRFAWSIEQLRILNVRAKEPLARHLNGKIWELREESNTNIYRLLYFFFSGRQIVFLHGFQKKTQKTPYREIDIALQRLDHYIKPKRDRR